MRKADTVLWDDGHYGLRRRRERHIFRHMHMLGKIHTGVKAEWCTLNKNVSLRFFGGCGEVLVSLMTKTPVLQVGSSGLTSGKLVLYFKPREGL